MHSSFCPDANFNLTSLVIYDQKETHHINNVLKLRSGHQIYVFNGKGEQALCRITAARSDRIRLTILSVQKALKTTPQITLACAMPKRGKFETIIEKATELGVDEVIPLRTQRSEVVIKAEKSSQKIKRFNAVAINAAKQCKRLTLPTIHPMTRFTSALKNLSAHSTVIIPSLTAKRDNLVHTLGTLKKIPHISILIGPEGDFTEKEYQQAFDRGCLPVTLGNTVLKVETAAIAAVACVNLYFAKNIPDN
jgi:16S rRNA (uracil1498-N3)-methyltransferase